jgi:hypothetical protein
MLQRTLLPQLQRQLLQWILLQHGLLWRSLLQARGGLLYRQQLSRVCDVLLCRWSILAVMLRRRIGASLL